MIPSLSLLMNIALFVVCMWFLKEPVWPIANVISAGPFGLPGMFYFSYITDVNSWFADHSVRKWKAWSASEKKSALEYLSIHIRNSTLPGKHECVNYLKCTGCDRSWSQVKDFIRNTLWKTRKTTIFQ